MRQVPQFKKSNMGSYVLALYVGFHQTVQSVISLVADLSKIHVPEDLANSYEQLVGQLTDNNNLQKARVSTEEQDAADAERDRLVSYLFFVISNALRSKKTDILNAGKLLETVVRPYRSVASQAYSAETGSIRGLICDLNKEEYMEAVSTLNLRNTIDELEEENEAFDALRKAAIDTAATRSRQASTVELRAQTDDVYNEICERIYASGLLAVEPDDVTLITNLINEINGIIDSYKTTHNQSMGQKKEKAPSTPPEETEPAIE